MGGLAITVDFPVKRYLRKYLQTKYGTNLLVASRSNALGYLVIALLNRTPDEPVVKDTYDDVFAVRVPESIYTSNGLYITGKQMVMFNKIVDKLFREELFHYIMMAHRFHGQKFSYALNEFLNYYGINEDDINSESLLKDFKRRKIKMMNHGY